MALEKCDLCDEWINPIGQHYCKPPQPAEEVKAKETELKVPVTFAGAMTRAAALFAKRNVQYRGSATEWYANFITATPVARKIVTPIGYALILAAKQDDAAFNALAQQDWEQFNERVLDGAIYRLIALALRDEGLT